MDAGRISPIAARAPRRHPAEVRLIGSRRCVPCPHPGDPEGSYPLWRPTASTWDTLVDALADLKAIDYIRNFASSWAKAKPPTKAMMVQSLYEEIVVRGAEFVSVRLAPEAYAHGLALALPQEVLVPAMRTKGRPRKMWASARPTGFRRARTHSGFKLIPIEGADDWEAATMSSA
jgi:hypothetical protein